MNNEEIDAYAKNCFDQFETMEDNRTDQKVGVHMAIFAILVQIAKRLPEAKEEK